MRTTWQIPFLLLTLAALTLGGLFTAAPTAAQGTVQVQTTAYLHLRAAPSTASTILATAPRGQVLTATAISPNYRWLRVTYAGQTGWMYRGFLDVVSGRVVTLPVSSESIPPAVTGGYVPVGAVIVSPITGLNLRMQPASDAALITVIPRGAEASARAVTPDGVWVFLEWNSYRGWAAGRYLNVITGSLDALTPPQEEAPPELQITYTASIETLFAGNCTTITWEVSGAEAVFYQDDPVTGSGSRVECPTVTTSYRLMVDAASGETVTRDLLITVVGGTPGVGVTPTPAGGGGGEGEAVINFVADRYVINSGECATLTWNVSNVQAVYYQEQGVTGSGSRQECPTASTIYRLRVTTLDGGSIERTVTITVN